MHFKNCSLTSATLKIGGEKYERSECGDSILRCIYNCPNFIKNNRNPKEDKPLNQCRNF